MPADADGISVIIPFRNASATFAAALDSLRNQTWRAFECVLIDNGSTDDSAHIAREFCAIDVRFRLLRHEGGLADVLNAGIEATTGPFIARMDADDLAMPERLQRQHELLDADSSVAIVSCLVEAFPEHAVRDGMRRYVAWINALRSPEQIRASLFVESPLVHPSVMMRRAALRHVGGYAGADAPEDYDLWFRLILSGHRAAKVPAVLLHWRDAPTRTTRIDPRCSPERIFQLKLRYFPVVVAPRTPIQVCGAGPIGRQWSHALRALGYPIRRIVDVDARKHGRRIAGAVVEPPDSVRMQDGFILAAVGVPGAREQIEQYLQQRGMRPWTNYLAVA